MALFNQKIHWKAIWEQVGLLLHVPAGMAAFSIIICIIFEEWYGIIPLAAVSLIGFGSGQLLYRAFAKKQKEAHLWDAMIIAAIGWLLCSFIAAVPFYWISVNCLNAGISSYPLQVFSRPINAVFEAFSGYTSTGLTMFQGGFLPHILQWWRSFLEWVGGLGIVVFILSLTHLNLQGFQLYYAEARTDQMSKNITKTAHWIWRIYLIYTSIAFLLFFIFGMPVWEALNHAFTTVSTGGFTLAKDSFASYNLGIQLSAAFIMILSAMSFLIHFRMIREGHFKILWKDMQNRLLYLFAACGFLVILLLNFWMGRKEEWLLSFFQWISALTTCGLSTADLSTFSPMVQLFLIMGMYVGGAAGSTTGGLKIRRFIYLASGVLLRLRTIAQKKEKLITHDYSRGKGSRQTEPPGIDLPRTEQSERLFTANVLFFLWTFTLLLGWFLILRWAPSGKPFDALFEVTSAMSNVGLTSGLLTPEFSSFGKGIFIFLMWIGRLEIIPAIILILSFPMAIKKKGKR